MTRPWRVDLLQCRGSAYDVGKQMAEGFLGMPRGRAYGRRKERRRPFAFNLKNAEAALKTWAPNIWEEFGDIDFTIRWSRSKAVQLRRDALAL